MRTLPARIRRKLHRILWSVLMKGYGFLLRIQRKPAQPDGSAGDRKVVYLTFDDGPDYRTEQLLDTLKRYNAKATFFAVGSSPYISVLKRTAAEGHAIGNHTSNHVCKELYKNEKSFLDALDKAERVIEEQTLKRPYVLRFPGGSETIRYHAGDAQLDRVLLRRVEERGYRYVDWDVDAKDTRGALTPMKVYRNVIDGIRGRDGAVVLLHDTKPYTVEAVEGILIWGLRNGYRFLPMDETSPTARHILP